MGTNFYFSTINKELAHKFDYHLTDEPDFHYEIHLAKTSYGWLPLFQSHKEIINSVADIKKIYMENSDKLSIVDECGKQYDWNEFYSGVVKFNGGIYGKVERYNILNDPSDKKTYDPFIPKTGPISHVEYFKNCGGSYSNEIFVDKDGYEFSKVEFS